MAGRTHKKHEHDLFYLVCTQLVNCLSSKRTLFSKPISTIEELFRAIDTHGSGYISIDELCAASARLDLGLHDEQVVAFFKYLDWSNTTRVTSGMLQYAVLQRDQIINMNTMKHEYGTLLEHMERLKEQIRKQNDVEKDARASLEDQSLSLLHMRKEMAANAEARQQAHAEEIQQILANAAATEKELRARIKRNKMMAMESKNTLDDLEKRHEQRERKLEEESEALVEALREQLQNLRDELDAQSQQSAKRTSRLAEEHEVVCRARSMLSSELRDAKSETAQAKRSAAAAKRLADRTSVKLREQQVQRDQDMEAASQRAEQDKLEWDQKEKDITNDYEKRLSTMAQHAKHQAETLQQSHNIEKSEWKANMNALQERLSAANEILAQAEANVGEKTEELAQTMGAKDRLQAETAVLTSDIAALQDKLAVAQEHITKAQVDASAKVQLLAKVTAEKDQLMTGTTAEKLSLVQDLTALKDQLSVARESAKQAQGETSTLTQLLTTVTAEKDRAHAEFAAEKSEKTSLVMDMAALKDQLLVAQDDTQKAQDEATENIQLLANVTAKRDQLDADVAAARSEHSTLATEMAALKKKLLAAQDDTQKAQDVVAAKIQLLASVTEERMQLKTEKGQLHAENEQLHMEKAKLSAHISVLDIKLNKAREDLKQVHSDGVKKKQLLSDVSELKGQLRAAIEDIEQGRALTSQLQSQANEKNQQLMKALSEQKQVSEETLVLLETEKQAHQNAAQTSEDTERRLRVAFQSLEDDFKSKHDEMLVSNDTNVELIESLSVATDELGKLGVAKGAP